MNDKKKARSVVGATEQAVTGQETGQATSPFINSNTAVKQRQQRVTNILQHGAGHAIPAPVLMRMLGLSDTRVLRHMVSAERESGSLILSGNSGYFLPSDGEEGQAEMSRYYAQVYSRATHALKCAIPVRKALGRLPGQVEIEMMEREGTA